ncbi:MAG: hypothetical protein AAGI88_22000, partial [Pseudomonadota bacterium]
IHRSLLSFSVFMWGYVSVMRVICVFSVFVGLGFGSGAVEPQCNKVGFGSGAGGLGLRPLPCDPRAYGAN